MTVSFVGSLDQMLPRDARPAPPPPASFAYQLNPIDAAVNNIQIVGPYDGKVPEDTASRKRIFVCQPTSASGRDGVRRHASSAALPGAPTAGR